MKAMKLELNLVRIDGGTQVRVEIDQETVNDYAERMLAGDEFDPIDVMYDGAAYWLWDGFHRFHACRKNSNATILARVTQGTREEATWASLGANRRHGKRLTREDKAKAIRTALEKFADKSNRAIAQQISVDHQTVQKYRKELEDNRGIPQLERRISVDGKSRPAHGQAPQPRVMTKEEYEAEATAEAAGLDDIPLDLDEPPAEEAATDQPTPDAAEPVKDRVGNVVTGKVAEAFLRRGEMTEKLRALSQIRKSILDACEADDPLYRDLKPDLFKADITNAYNSLSNAQPHALCLSCKGDGNFGTCKPCLGRGWMNEVNYKAKLVGGA